MSKKMRILGLIVPSVFLLDQWTKHLIDRSLAIGSVIPILPGFFDIVHTRNRGAAFGFMSTLPDEIRLPFFYIVSFFALSAITIYFLRLKEDRTSVFLCLALILGGAAGNICDRILRGEVVDFLSFHWYDQVAQWKVFGHWIRFRLEWPAFNVADAAISIAVIGLMILMSRAEKTS